MREQDGSIRRPHRHPAVNAPALAGAPVSMRWRPFRLPLRSRFEAAHGALADRLGVLVALRDADGNVGVGEASPLPSFGGGTVEDVLALLHAGGAALLDERAWPDGHAPGGAALRCALDVARLDLAGRALGLPLCALLADEHAPAPEVAVNAVIGNGTPDEVARYAREAVAAGYRTLKLKVGVGTLADDLARVQAVRLACPDAEVRADANGAWDEPDAARAIAALADAGVALLEQPVRADAVDALERLHAAARLTLAADEAVPTDALDAILARGAAAVIVLKPMMLGGLRPALAIARRAEARGLGVLATTTFDSSIGTAAALHLAALLPWTGAHGLGTGEHLDDDLVTPTLIAADGRMAVPSAPGLGVEVDPDALERLATGPWRDG